MFKIISGSTVASLKRIPIFWGGILYIVHKFYPIRFHIITFFSLFF